MHAMNTALSQRWREGRSSFRPAGDLINPAEYEVAALPEAQAKAFVLTHHYARSYPAARFRYGLFRRGELVGAAVYSVPVSNRVLAAFPGEPIESVELGRFVLLDQVPANGETYFLGRTFELLRKAGIIGVISFSDPVARATSEGRLIFPGHVGTIYQAHNAVYAGRATARTLRLLPDGRVFSARAEQKVRGQERGYRYAAAQLEAYGAEPLSGDPARWLDRWLARLTRPLRHPGNHRYLWGLNRQVRKALPHSLPYPKRLLEQLALPLAA